MPAVHRIPGVADRLRPWLQEHSPGLENCWALVYPQAASHGLTEKLCRQLVGLDAHAPHERVFSAADGLLTIKQARACCESLWSAWHRAEIRNPVLLAIGGGSVMDLAKLARWFPDSAQRERLRDFHDEAWLTWMLGHHERLHRAFLVLMPTTSGTGSEVTAYATLWGQSKQSFTGARAFADAALIDYELSMHCPYELTRDCGLDALAHALDALWNRRAQAQDRVAAIRIASVIVSVLPPLLRELDSASLRQAMSDAALEAGQLIAKTQTSLVHALSYAASSERWVAHFNLGVLRDRARKENRFT
ncbi:MAG: iron-containing alcohol dehydrogenase, partial [Betaproteobacteria bacterium]|nr:iron-containing alcohol dehydrogenase [Betaproteobacteria bacterium]